ncbi:hypothetical protein EYF80_001513 [Liparis tanakae]|uniref:Uncharacterized protein n=1 Tax=Liparis tanakae TaxID=230148 RepID=A0A4Z2JE91_9TELE|nr:hypothetical protein EYF80_001513 [Liparis tanakae]
MTTTQTCEAVQQARGPQGDTYVKQLPSSLGSLSHVGAWRRGGGVSESADSIGTATHVTSRSQFQLAAFTDSHAASVCQQHSLHAGSPGTSPLALPGVASPDSSLCSACFPAAPLQCATAGPQTQTLRRTGTAHGELDRIIFVEGRDQDRSSHSSPPHQYFTPSREHNKLPRDRLNTSTCDEQAEGVTTRG